MHDKSDDDDDEKAVDKVEVKSKSETLMGFNIKILNEKPTNFMIMILKFS